MENRNGQGIFLGVVGVATLVVAIIGATFAFFSAQITGNNTVDAEAYVFASTLGVSEISGQADITDGGLIPMKSNLMLTAANTGSNGKKCVDSNGYDACEIYELTFTNTGTSTVTFTGELTITENSFTNGSLIVAEFDTEETQVLGSLAAPTEHALARSTTEQPASDEDKTVELKSITVPTGEPTVIYLVVYLNDDDSNQKNDMGQKFSATLTYTSEDGNELTAKF